MFAATTKVPNHLVDIFSFNKSTLEYSLPLVFAINITRQSYHLVSIFQVYIENIYFPVQFCLRYFMPSRRNVLG